MAQPTFAPDLVRPFVSALFQSCRVPAADADRVAECLVSADLRGISSHGVGRVPIYLDRLRKGLVNPTPCMTVTPAMTVAARVDGDNGLGFLVGTRAMAEAVRIAQQHGLGFVLAHHSSQVEDEPQTQHRFDCQVSVTGLTAGLAPARRTPSGQRCLVQPQREITVASQPCLVSPPLGAVGNPFGPGQQPAIGQPADAPQPARQPRTAPRDAQRQTRAAPGGGPGQVWVNASSKAYHCPGTRYYGTTKRGEYMTEAAAKAGGAHVAGGRACS